MELIGILAFVAASAFFSGIETGVIAANPLRLRHMVEEGVRGAKVILEFHQQTERLLGTVLIGTNLCNVGASVLAASVGLRMAPRHGEWVAAVCTTIIVLIAGEMVPKAWFRHAPAVRSVRFHAALVVAYRVLWPLVKMSQGLSRLVNMGIGPAPPSPGVLVTRDDLADLASESALGGRLSAEEKGMIDAVLEARGTRTAEIMAPAASCAIAAPNDPVEAALALAREHGVSRLPVVAPESRRPVGLLNVYDLLFEPEKHAGALVREAMREVKIVRGDDTIDRVLARLKEWRQPLAPVCDRRGRFIGAVSIEDVLEEVVGEIEG